MIIYIHGFGGSGQGSKARLLRSYFHSIEEDFIAPSLSYVPELAIETLKELIESYHGNVSLIGSSLGGYYATYLSNMKEVKKIILINPATHPRNTLKRALGSGENFYDSSSYEWNEKHIEMLQMYERDVSSELENYMVLLQKGDEFLDYRDATQKYDGAKVIVEDGGNHSFEGIENYFEQMREFLEV